MNIFWIYYESIIYYVFRISYSDIINLSKNAIVRYALDATM